MKIIRKNKIPLLLIILAVILIIGGLIFVLKYSDKKSLLGKKLDKDYQENLKNLKDSDNDGLRDWEEELYKTDPYNSDTDNDGYLDGEEVDSDHNPLIKAPGDELTFHPLPLGDKYNISKKIFNGEVLQNVLGSYLSQVSEYLQNHPEINSPDQLSALENQPITNEMAEKSINDNYANLLEQYLPELLEIFDISISDDEIKISQDNSKEAIGLYVFGISQWLNSDIFFLQNEALQIIGNALGNQDFNNLDRLIKLNDSWIDKMKEIAVPSSWKEIHKQGFKIIIMTRNIFISLRDYENDPIKAYYAAEKLYEEVASAWTELIKQAINLAKTQGVKLPL